MVSSESEDNSSWIFDSFLDMLEEEDGFTAIDNPVIIGKGHVHNWSRLDLISDDDSSIFGGVHSEDGALRWVDDWSSHHGAEDTSVGDGETSACHILKGDLALSGLLTESSEFFLDVVHLHGLRITEDWDDEAFWGGNGDTDINEISVNDIFSVNHCIHDGGFH